MKRPTFIRGAVVAFVFALAGAAAFTSLKLLLGPLVVLKLIIAALAGAYTLYLVAASGEKTGRLTAPVFWLAGAIAAWSFLPGLTLYIFAHLGMVWLMRSLYFHTSVLPALIDLGLCTLGLLGALATARHTHSIFLTIWSFFLVQALFVAIPTLTKTTPAARTDNAELRFKRALHTAEAAVRRLHTTH